MIEKITYKELSDIFEKYNQEHHDGSYITGVIVYKNESFDQEYPLESRSYRVKSDCKAFLNTIGRSLWGSSLDGSDPHVRLDLYDWKIDYCYLGDFAPFYIVASDRDFLDIDGFSTSDGYTYAEPCTRKNTNIEDLKKRIGKFEKTEAEDAINEIIKYEKSIMGRVAEAMTEEEVRDYWKIILVKTEKQFNEIINKVVYGDKNE